VAPKASHPAGRPIAIGLVLIVVTLMLQLFLQDTRDQTRPETAAEARARAVTQAQREAEGYPESGGPEMAMPEAGDPTSGVAPSLRGTELDGALSVDASGRLLLDRELRRLFDHLLAGMGEVSLDSLRERLRHVALDQGGEALAAQVLAAFERYLDYLRAEDRLVLPPGSGPAERLDALMALRRSELGEELAEAWFGEEERYALSALERLVGDEQAADPEAAQRWQAERDEATGFQLAVEQTEQFDQLGISAEQRFAEREAMYGEAAARRLAALDAERAAWQRRLLEWRAERERLLADASLGAAAREAALEAALQARFDEAEQRRVRALDELPPEGE